MTYTDNIYILEPPIKKRIDSLEFEFLKINYKRYRIILRAEKIH